MSVAAPEETEMTNDQKIERLEHALRTERDYLRGRAPAGQVHNGERHVGAANAINTYLVSASDESKLRFANILLGSAA